MHVNSVTDWGGGSQCGKLITCQCKGESVDLLTPDTVYIILTLNVVRQYFSSFPFLHNSEVTVNLSHWDAGLGEKNVYVKNDN